MIYKRFTLLDVSVFALCLLNFVFIVSFYSRIELFGADSSYYIELARSLLENGTYSFNYITHTKYPPGVPLVLYVSSLIFDSTSFTVYVRVMGFLGILALLTAYWTVRMYNAKYAAIITLLVLSSPWFFLLATTIVLSDLPYFFSSMVVLLCSILIDRQVRENKLLVYVLLSLALVLSVLFRTVAISLLSGMILFISYSFFVSKDIGRNRMKKFLPALVIGLLAFGLWISWSAVNRVPYYDFQYMDSYLVQLLLKDPHIPDLGGASFWDIILRLQHNIPRIFADLSQIALHYPYVSDIFYSPAVALPIMLLIVGLGHNFKSGGNDLAAWYLLSYLGIFVLWPFNEGPRFILPVFPLAALYIFIGAETLYNKYQKNRLRYGRIFLLIAALFFLMSVIDLFVHGSERGRQGFISCAFWGISIFFLPLHYKESFASIFTKVVDNKAWLQGAGMLVLLFVTVAGYAQQINLARKNIAPNPSEFRHHASVQAARWINANLADERIIMGGQYAILHRLSQNKVIPFPVTGQAQKIIDVINRHKVEYLVVVATDDNPYFLPTEEQRMERLINNGKNIFSLKYHGDEFNIFTIQPE